MEAEDAGGAWVVDLAALEGQEPLVRGSVQTIYRWEHGGVPYLLTRAADQGSVFDVGTFFSIPGSGRSRTELRHALYRRLASSGAWRSLRLEDLAACYPAEEASRWWESPLLAELREHGAATHHVGLVEEGTGRVTDEPVPSAMVLVREFPVVRPEHFTYHRRPAWDYHRYQVQGTKLLALEHIFRLGSPAGSSIAQRYRTAVASGDPEAPARLLATLGLEHPVVPWGRFGTMLYDCSTKYEDHDRYLDWQEAVHVSGVDHDTFTGAVDLLSLCTVMVHAVFARMGFVLWDIKWEAAVEDGRVVVVDTVDHDSVRITSGVEVDGRRCYSQFNKQAVRDYYRILHPEWVAALDHAKAQAESDPDGRTFLQIYRRGVEAGGYPAIPELDPEFAAIMAEKYSLVAAGASGRRPAGSGVDAVRAVVEAEVSFYAGRGRGEAFLEHVTVP